MRRGVDIGGILRRVYANRKGPFCPKIVRMEREYQYRPEVLAELAKRGIVPKKTTPPDKVRALVGNIYVFRVRDLKVRREEMERVLGPQPLEDYRRQVDALRVEYQPLLGLPAESWIIRPYPPDVMALAY